MKKCLSVLGILLLTFNPYKAFAGNDDKSLVRKADHAFKKAQLGDALSYYLKALAVNPQDCYANFQTGAIYYITDSSRIKSVPYFENCIKFTPKGEDTIIDAYYYLGNCYILQKNYSQAVVSFQVYLAHLVDDKTDRAIIKEVENNIGIAQSAPSLAQRTPDSASYFINGKLQPIYIKNLGNLVNSPNPEYAQIIMNSDSMIVFTSRRPTSQNGKKDKFSESYYEDIFYSKKDASGNWAVPSLFSNQLHFSPKRYNLASVSISPDGKTLFVFHKGLIYQSAKTSTGWAEPVRIGNNIKQIKKFMPSVFVSYDGKKLLLVSDRKGGYGGKDIYMCTLDSKGVWSYPQNLGSDVNTAFDEDAPYLMPDNKTLFFSSKGHKGLGGYDIFKSVYENGKWSTPQNVGAPINSTADDIFFTFDTATKKGYFSSSRINEGYGDMDIYSLSFNCDNIKNTELQGKIVSGNPSKGISSASIALVDGSGQNTSASSDGSGKFSLQLKPDTKYMLSIKAPGFINSTAAIVTPHQCDAYNLYQVISLSYSGSDSLHTGQTVSLKNAFYHGTQPGYKSAKNDPDVSGLASSFNDQGDIWLKDTNFALNYTQAQIDSLNPHAAKVVAVTQVAKSETIPSKFPTVRFELNSSIIAASYYPSLDSIAKLMRINTKIKLQISGYADNSGGEELNKHLSQSRASAVAAYLTKKGVKASNIRTEGKGTANPVAPNDGSQNYLNRRAELMVIQ